MVVWMGEGAEEGGSSDLTDPPLAWLAVTVW